MIIMIMTFGSGSKSTGGVASQPASARTTAEETHKRRINEESNTVLLPSAKSSSPLSLHSRVTSLSLVGEHYEVWASGGESRP